MFGLTWANVKKPFLWSGIINPPKGEGKYYSFFVVCKANIWSRKKLRKYWDSVFSRGDVPSQYFSELMEQNTVRLSDVDAQLYYKAAKKFKGHSCPLSVSDYSDQTERLNHQKQKQYRLDIARKNEEKALQDGDTFKAAEAREEVDRLKKELNGIPIAASMFDGF